MSVMDQTPTINARPLDRKYPPHRTKERVSLGVACCRFNKGRPEILLICKRFSYSYNNFVHGKYISTSNAEIIELLNGMTAAEKHVILSLNFTQIWYHIWFDAFKCTNNFFYSKNKFENTFLIPGGAERLKRLVAKSTHSDLVWEIPKGRRKTKTEPDIHCAVREFYEETGVSKKSYTIYPQTRTYSYIDDGVRYTNTYYIAIATHHFTPRVDMGRASQVEEISDIRWMNIDEVRMIDPTGRLEPFLRPVFNFMKIHGKK